MNDSGISAVWVWQVQSFPATLLIFWESSQSSGLSPLTDDSRDNNSSTWPLSSTPGSWQLILMLGSATLQVVSWTELLSGQFNSSLFCEALTWQMGKSHACCLSNSGNTEQPFQVWVRLYSLTFSLSHTLVHGWHFSKKIPNTILFNLLKDSLFTQLGGERWATKGKIVFPFLSSFPFSLLPLLLPTGYTNTKDNGLQYSSIPKKKMQMKF